MLVMKLVATGITPAKTGLSPACKSFFIIRRSQRPQGRGTPAHERGLILHIEYSSPSDATRIRDLLAKLALTQRAAARELEISERDMRYYEGRHAGARAASRPAEAPERMSIRSGSADLFVAVPLFRTHRKTRRATLDSAKPRTAEREAVMTPDVFRRDNFAPTQSSRDSAGFRLSLA
jgi:hypothetical protein